MSKSRMWTGRTWRRPLLAAGALMLLLGAGCKGSSKDEGTVPPTPPVKSSNDDGRTALFSPDEELYGRVEGIGAANACTSDADCMTSGCSNEVCSAERIVTTCEVRTWPQHMGAQCGCVDGQCVWYK